MAAPTAHANSDEGAIGNVAAIVVSPAAAMAATHAPYEPAALPSFVARNSNAHAMADATAACHAAPQRAAAPVSPSNTSMTDGANGVRNPTGNSASNAASATPTNNEAQEQRIACRQ
jgi:hypothetical protein